jgi:hypothetical protein
MRMLNPLYEKLAAHIGHKVVVVQYAEGENVAVECEDCHEVLTDEDRDIEDEPTTYGEVGWSAEDVQTLRPDLTDDQATAFLRRNERHIRDRLTELGWQVIDVNLQMDDQLPDAPPEDDTKDES